MTDSVLDRLCDSLRYAFRQRDRVVFGPAGTGTDRGQRPIAVGAHLFPPSGIRARLPLLS